MADKDKYHGYTSDDDSFEDSFTGLLYDLFDVKIASGYLSNFNSDSYDEFMKWAFISFKKTCRETYESMIGKEDKAYYYFRDTLSDYQLLKEKFFYEKEGQLYHILVNKPVSKEGDRNQQLVYVSHKYLSRAIAVLEDYVKRLSTYNPSSKQSDPPPKKSKSKIHGFNVKNQECLKDAYNQLIKFEIIANDVSYLDFEKAFLGQIPNNKIRWLLRPGFLHYFIKSINGVGIRPENKNIWNTTLNCFKDIDGNDFNKSQLSRAHNPIHIKDVKIVVDTFNEDYASNL